MSIIELNLEKPALKRVESVEESKSQSGQSHQQQSKSGQQSEQSGQQSGQSGQQSGQSDQQQSGGKGKSRIKKYGRRMAILGGSAAGAAAVRKLRQRRKSKGQQQDLEEDWQTADSPSGSSGSQ